jgi:DNA-binding SARP family transcriptional activator/formylglycine-generating enzyme required for sulfatase activity
MVNETALNSAPYLLRLLGTPRVEGPDGVLEGPVAQRHRLALLGLLALAPHTVLPRDRLLGILWPENATESARSLLNAAVHAVRKALGDEVLVNQGNGIWLNTTKLRIDVVEFEGAVRDGDLVRSVDLYTGPFLDGLALPGAVDFEHWLDIERDRLERLYHTALEQRALQVARDAGPQEAVPWWRRRLACTPADGRVVMQLLRNLANGGDRAGALDVAASHSKLLRDEFGLPPDPDVESAAEELRRAPDASGVKEEKGGERRDSQVLAASASAKLTADQAEMQGLPHETLRFGRRAPPTAGVRKPLILIGGIIAAMVLGWAGTRPWQPSGAQWARDVALPRALRLLDEGDAVSAFRLLREAQRHLPGEPLLNELLLRSTFPVSVSTIPADAQVSVRDFSDETSAWELLGSSPLDVRLPETATLVWRISAEGFQTVVTVRKATMLPVPFVLAPAAEAPAEMVYVPGGHSAIELLSAHPTDLDPFWIDRHEVTNRQFKSFLDKGGYQHPDFWTEPVVESVVVLDWDERQQLFRDLTGRSGPATWHVGSYPAGQHDHPVGGISWYEAAAYCASVGKQLPTVHQWYQAADLAQVDAVVHLSNLESDGPSDVGRPLALGGHGTYDMAGNVKEWVWNEDSAGRRFVLGGGWNEPIYQFGGYDARLPLEREAVFGFRCARNSRPLSAEQAGPVSAPFVDWRQVVPVPDEVFTVYRNLYQYDHTPLEPAVESERVRSNDWTMERVSFAAAYANERVPALLFLPKNVAPPYQTVVYYPGIDAFSRPGVRPTWREEMGAGAPWFSFLIRSGRAVLSPVYKGSYQRHIGSPFLPNIWHEIVIKSAKDLRRAVDYLETRRDIDSERIAHFTLSSGAALGPIMTAVEPRLKASILIGGGLLPWRHDPEVESINFAPHVRVPTLMINGRRDFYYPYETSQVPLFALLGLPSRDKRHRLFESGHLPFERSEIIRESLDWLDLNLGEVKR